MKKNISFFVLLIVVLMTACTNSTTNSSNSYSSQESASSETSSTQLRENEERERMEQQNKQRMKQLSQTLWSLVAGDPYGQCVVTYIDFKTNGNGTMWTEYFVGGNRINSSSNYPFGYFAEGDRIYFEGEYSFDFDGSNLVSRGGEKYSKGRPSWTY